MNQASGQGGLSPTVPFVDFDLHGLVGVRLVAPAARDVASVAKQLGPFQAALAREPDITIRFERDLTPPTLTYIGLNSAAFTAEDFYLLDRASGRLAARIPFDELGLPCEITCQSGLGSVPLLPDIIRLTFLKKGYVSLHGAAFCFNGRGILVAGWTKGGKTETLMSFANHGAHYVADEWVLLSEDGERMLGLPVQVTLWDWQLEQVAPHLRPKLSGESRALHWGIHSLDAVHRRLGYGRLKGILPVKALGKLLPVLRGGLNVRASPKTVFGDLYREQGAPIDKLMLVMSHSRPDIVVEPCDPTVIARRMVLSNEYEEGHLQRQYRAYRFAFPDRCNPTLESAQEVRSSLLCHALEGKEAYQVFHPYPVSFEQLYKSLRPLC
jgi:hypothetical protein